MQNAGFLTTLLIYLSYGTVSIRFRDLGAHIDGFIAVVAHTFVIGASKVGTISQKCTINGNCYKGGRVGIWTPAHLGLKK